MSGLDEDVLDEPPASLIFRPRVRVLRSIVELWAARALVRALVEREFRARYKQAALGIAWAFITPVAYVVVFTVFFQRAVKVDTGGVPYAIYSYVGLLPWTFFSTSTNQGSSSLLANTSLLNKVYCPREVFPLAAVSGAALDSLIATIPLAGMFLLYGFAPAAEAVLLPVLLSVLVCYSVGVALVLSSVTVYLRDVRHLIPIVLQLGLFATPVAYSLDVIPANFRLLYSFANPVAPVIDGIRRTMLLGLMPRWDLLFAGAVSSLLLVLFGYRLFKRLERGLADVA